MSFKGVLVAFALVSGTMVTPLFAQTPVAPGMERLQDVMALAKQAMNPAATALGHREALGLTAEQVTALEKVSASLEPTIEAFATMSSSAAPAISAASSGGTVDREAIRAAYLQQAETQADVVATMAEAGQQVQAILTVEQRASIEQLQLAAMMEMMRSVGLAPTP
jgi:Spy/CpxP family protein refolding chaperone